MSERQYPGGSSDPGLAAVRQKYGEDMVEFCRNLPKRIENELRAQYETAADHDRIEVHRWEQQRIASGVEAARQTVARLRGNRDYALEFARKAAEWVPRDQWALVPSVSQYRAVFFDGVTPPSGRVPSPEALERLRKRAAESGPESLSAVVLSAYETAMSE